MPLKYELKHCFLKYKCKLMLTRYKIERFKGQDLIKTMLLGAISLLEKIKTILQKTASKSD